MIVRPWVLGFALFAGGLATHLVFEIWAAPFAGRIEMGQFACLEGFLYTVGLGIVFVHLAFAPVPPGTGQVRFVGGVCWGIGVLIAVVAVLRRLPA